MSAARATGAPRRRGSKAARVIRYERPPLYREQEEFLFTPARYSIVEASTKTGKTSGCLIWLGERAALHGGKGRHFWWVAPVYRQADIAFERFKRYTPKWAFKANDSRRTVTLLNGSIIEFLSADNPDRLYGEDVDAAVLDEATRMREASWHAVRSTLTATQGPLRIIGNVKGRKNWVYKLARRAQAGEAGMYYAKLTAWHAVAAGILPVSEVLDAQRMLPKHVFEELYLAIPSEDGANPFGIEHLAACFARQQTATDGRGLSGFPVVCWGWDLAKSLDWTVGVGLDAYGNTAAFHRWQKPWAETLREIRAIVGTTPAVIDSTGVGDPVVEFLQRSAGLELGLSAAEVVEFNQLTPLEAAREMLRRQAATAEADTAREAELARLTASCPNIIGYRFTGPSKQALLEMYAVAVQQHEIGLYADAREVVKAEHEDFEFVQTRTGTRYAAPEGQHDDVVIAYALANHARTTARLSANAGGASVAF